MIKKYRKKPVIIEAIKWTGNNEQEIIDFAANSYRLIKFLNFEQNIAIETLEGTMIANKGDYIIKGIKNELYPCKADIFKQTYEEVK